MPRKPSPDTPQRLGTTLPSSVYAQLAAHLYSPIEGRIPLGSWNGFIAERIREFFGWRSLDLGQHGLPAGYFVKGPPAMIEELERRLKA